HGPDQEGRGGHSLHLREPSPDVTISIVRRAPARSVAGNAGGRRSFSARLVPAPDDAGLVLITQHRHGRGVERQEPAVVGGQPAPTGGEDPELVAVPEQSDEPTRSSNDLDHAIGTCTYGFGGLTTGTRVRPYGPSRYLPADLSGRATLVVAVVPLPEVFASHHA